MKTIKTDLFTILTANDGCVFRNKLTGNSLTATLYLGCNDSADNYEEISIEEAEKISEEESEENENDN